MKASHDGSEAPEKKLKLPQQRQVNLQLEPPLGVHTETFKDL